MIETERLLLRQWRDEDRAPFAAMNADPEVMEYFPALMTRQESDAAVDRQIAYIAHDGFGNYAVERRADGAFLGHVGLKETGPELPFGGAPEIGWRLLRSAWGSGYASEAAAALLTFGFRRGLPEIVSFTASANLRSQGVMHRIGMIRAPQRDFDHPGVPEGHALRRHLVWALGGTTSTGSA